MALPYLNLAGPEGVEIITWVCRY